MFLAAAVLARRSNLAGFAPDAGDDADAACSQQHTAVRAQAAWPEVPLCRGQGMDLKVWRRAGTISGRETALSGIELNIRNRFMHVENGSTYKKRVMQVLISDS